MSRIVCVLAVLCCLVAPVASQCMNFTASLDALKAAAGSNTVTDFILAQYSVDFTTAGPILFGDIAANSGACTGDSLADGSQCIIGLSCAQSAAMPPTTTLTLTCQGTAFSALPGAQTPYNLFLSLVVQAQADATLAGKSSSLYCGCSDTDCATCSAYTTCTTCKSPKQVNTTTHACQSCPTVGCATCDSSFTCLTCTSPDDVLVNGACVACTASHCDTCFGAATNCSSCSEGYSLSSGHCCPGSQVYLSGICCAAGQINSNGICCATGEYNSNGSCCATGKVNIGGGLCCGTGQYNSSNLCCDTGKVNTNGICCTNGQINSNSVCCPVNQTGFGSICCPAGQTGNGGVCCPTGQFGIGGICCSTNSSINSGGICCPSSNYKNIGGNCCSAGLSHCAACNSSAPGVCTACNSTYVLGSNGLCTFSGPCNPLKPNCELCDGPTADASCKTCSANYILREDKTCMYNGTCPNNCMTCSSAMDCTNCTANYTYNAASKICVYSVKTTVTVQNNTMSTIGGGSASAPSNVTVSLGADSNIDASAPGSSVVAYAPVAVSAGASVEVKGNVTFTVGLSLDNGATLTLTAATITISTTFSVSVMATVTFSAGASVTAQAANLTGGSLSFTATATFVVKADMTLSNTTALTFTLPAAGSTTTPVAIGGNAVLAGSITMTLPAELPAGQQQIVITFGSSSGAFSSVTINVAAGGSGQASRRLLAGSDYDLSCGTSNCVVKHKDTTTATTGMDAGTTGDAGLVAADSSKLTDGAIAGIAVGASVGGLLIICGLVLIVRRCCCKPAEKPAKSLDNKASKSGSGASSANISGSASGSASGSGKASGSAQASGSGQASGSAQEASGSAGSESA